MTSGGAKTSSTGMDDLMLAAIVLVAGASIAAVISYGAGTSPQAGRSDTTIHIQVVVDGLGG